MKTTTDTFYTTAQGRLPRTLSNEQLMALDAYGKLYSAAERSYISALTRGEAINKKVWLIAYGITGRQFNAVKRSAEGKVESQISNLDNYLQKQSVKKGQLQNSEERIRDAIKKEKARAKTQSQDAVLDTLYQKLRRVKHAQQINENKISSFYAQKVNKKPSICMGSRKLFKAQNRLVKNGYTTHSEWLRDWRASRSSQFFIVGSKDESMGCQGCTMSIQDNGKVTLRIRMPNRLEEEHGKHLIIEDVEIGYQPELLEMASELNDRRSFRKSRIAAINRAIQKRNAAHGEWKAKSTIQLAAALAPYGLAVNYRFVRDKKDWRVLVSMAKPNIPQIHTDGAKGAIGIDLNADHLAVSEIDHQGNLVDSWSVAIPSDFKVTSRQNKTAIETACKGIIAHASSTGKPVFIEDLDFTFKKANLHKGKNAQYNKMLSTLTYRIFKQAITRQAIQQGVAAKVVNPAYTSFIGRIKYINQTHGSVHEAAAMVIARRGNGHRDRLPKESRQTFRSASRTFLLPEDCKKDGYAVYRKAKEAFDKWMKAQISDLKLRHQDILERRRYMNFVNQLEADLNFALSL